MKTSLCLGFILFGLASSASVWDDAEMVFVPWDRNGDGICNAGVQNKSIKSVVPEQQPEIIDLKRASLGTDSSVNSPGIYGCRDALQIVSDTMTLSGTECGRSVPCFKFQCPEVDGKYCPPTLRWHSSFGTDMTTAFDGVEAYTIVLRFKRGRSYDPTKPNYIFNFGGWDTVKNKGFGIALTRKEENGDETTRRLSICQAGTRQDLKGYIPEDEWIDVAVVSDPVNRRFRYAVRAESHDVTWGNAGYLNADYSPAPYNHDYVLGADYSTATEATATENWAKFNGLVRHLAIWKRSLSDDEVKEVFVGGSDSPAVFPDCWQVGFDGGDAKYFAAGGTGTFRVGKDPFYLMNGELPCKGSELAFSFDVGVTNANHAQVLRLRAALGSAPGELALLAEGEEVGRVKVATGKVATLFVPGSRLSSGMKTWTLRRVDDGSSALTIGRMTLGGSWMLGLDDRQIQLGEFEVAPVTRDLTVDSFVDWRHLARTINDSSDADRHLKIRFTVPEELKRYRFAYYAAARPSNAAWEAHVIADAVELYRGPFNWPNELGGNLADKADNAGEHLVEWTFDSTRTTTDMAYGSFDYHRVEIREPAPGFILIFR